MALMRYLVLIAMIVSILGCRTPGSETTLKGTPDQDPVVNDLWQRHCSGTVPTIELVAAHPWSCYWRSAVQNDFRTLANLDFNVSSTDGNTVFTSGGEFLDGSGRNVGLNVGPFFSTTDKFSQELTMCNAQNRCWRNERIGRVDQNGNLIFATVLIDQPVDSSYTIYCQHTAFQVMNFISCSKTP